MENIWKIVIILEKKEERVRRVITVGKELMQWITRDLTKESRLNEILIWKDSFS